MATSSLRSLAAALACAGALLPAGAAEPEAPAAADGPLEAVQAPPVVAGARSPGGELRVSWTGHRNATLGPLAAANRLQPGIAPPPVNTALAEAELRHTLRGRLGDAPLALSANLLLQGQLPSGAPARTDARFNELNVSADLGAWQLLAGKKVLGWDVGYGFRPNDFVQQETRRQLLPVTPEGRPLLQLEHFEAERAVSLVWVHPQRLDASDDASRGPDESALALRVYQRFGALDAFAFAREGAHTGASVGGAAAWVATDELELHASARLLQRYDGWRLAARTGDAPVPTNPWAQAMHGRASQWLLGASWTGFAQQSVLVEYWHDGTTLADSEWDAWQRRNAALPHAPGPVLRAAGNLAWQATPFAGQNLRRDNLFVRFAWQPDRWQLAFDTLFMPADRGRIYTASVQWQGDRWRFNAALRSNGGADDSVAAQLPSRHSLLLAAVRSF